MSEKIKLKRRYFRLILLLFTVALVTIISSNLYKNYSKNALNKSYISKYVSNVQFNELKNVMLELSSDAFLYISYTGSPEVRSLELKMKKTLKDNEIIDNFIYLNVDDLIKDNAHIDKLNAALALDNYKIAKLPAIVYYKDNKVVDLIDSKESFLDNGNFVQLIEKYEINK